jgi:hypothetical protein
MENTLFFAKYPLQKRPLTNDFSKILKNLQKKSSDLTPLYGIREKNLLIHILVNRLPKRPISLSVPLELRIRKRSSVYAQFA